MIVEVVNLGCSASDVGLAYEVVPLVLESELPFTLRVNKNTLSNAKSIILLNVTHLCL